MYLCNLVIQPLQYSLPFVGLWDMSPVSTPYVRYCPLRKLSAFGDQYFWIHTFANCRLLDCFLFKSFVRGSSCNLSRRKRVTEWGQDYPDIMHGTTRNVSIGFLIDSFVMLHACILSFRDYPIPSLAHMPDDTCKIIIVASSTEIVWGRAY